MRLDPFFITHQIAALSHEYPELVGDEEGWALSVESETDAITLLRAVENKRYDAEKMALALGLGIEEREIRQARFERREKAMRALALRIMRAAGLKKVELPEATLSEVNGKPRVIITNEFIIPDELCKFVRSPDKTAIKNVIDSGSDVRGATISNSEPHLTIRTR